MNARCFIIRHGETEWSINGRHTGTTELPLTANGESRIRATGRALVGDDRLIAPKKLSHVFVSPRKRARDTLHLLGLGVTSYDIPCEGTHHGCEAKVEVVEELREFDYGIYEGITSSEVRKLRKGHGLDKEHNWDIWKDGCEGGESPEEVTARVDSLIARIRETYHKQALEGGNDISQGDILCVAHGHILRAFAMRWVGSKLGDGPSLILEAGGVGVLSYEHHNIEEPAIVLGGSFVVDAVQRAITDAHQAPK